MNNKQTIYVDLDNTVFNSVKAVVDLYNDEFQTHVNYKPVHWTEINQYGFEQLNLGIGLNYETYFYKYFDDEKFFAVLEYMDTAYEVLLYLLSNYHIVFVSKGSDTNKLLKTYFIKSCFEDYDYELIILDEQTKDKSSVDMSDGLCFIDDMPINLQHSNCPHKILFGDIFTWENHDITDYVRCYNWTDVLNYINTLGA